MQRVIMIFRVMYLIKDKDICLSIYNTVWIDCLPVEICLY